MLPDDPRHGTNAGYIAHEVSGERPCQPCKDGRFKSRKRVELDRIRGERMTYTSAEAMAVIQPWLDMGLSMSAIMIAAGYDHRRCGDLKRILERDSWIRRGTYRSLAAITEADFGDNAKINADLTRRRVYSLMAAGHRLQDMPLSSAGRWRDRKRITVRVARDVRAHFIAHEAKIGTSMVTMSRARNAGHRPPLAWDDPGTLAWPDGMAPKMQRPSRAYRPHDEIDPVIVDRLLGGESIREATNAERKEAMRRWLAMGNSERSLCKALGWKDGRYLPRKVEAPAWPALLIVGYWKALMERDEVAA